MKAEKYIDTFKSQDIEIVPLAWTLKDYVEHLFDFFITGFPRQGVSSISLSWHGGIVVDIDGQKSYFSLINNEKITDDLKLMISIMKRKNWKFVIKEEYKSWVKSIPDSLCRI